MDRLSAGTVAQKSFQGYCDGHKDTYLNTDVSTRADAASMHINYSASIGKVTHLPEIYLVVGRAATGQLAVFGSQPGEARAPYATGLMPHMGASVKVTFAKAGTYKLTTKEGDDYYPGMKTTGPDNILHATIVVS